MSTYGVTIHFKDRGPIERFVDARSAAAAIRLIEFHLGLDLPRNTKVRCCE